MGRRFSLRELADISGSSPAGDLDLTISGVGQLDSATSDDIALAYWDLLLDDKRLRSVGASSAGIVCVPGDFPLIEGRSFLLSDCPTSTFQTLAKVILGIPDTSSGFELIHPSAVVHDSVKIGDMVRIGPCAVIERDVHIGARSHIHSGVYIGVGVYIGEDCIIYPNATIQSRCSIGDRVILQPSSVVGSCGFGYSTDKNTWVHKHIEHIGAVEIGDDVHVGACSTINRGKLYNTIVSAGTKIGDMVHIAHNVMVGKNNLVVAQSGIAGSSRTGSNVVLAAQSGVTNNVELTDGVIISAKSGVSKSISNPGIYRGTPAIPIGDYQRRKARERRFFSTRRQV